MQIIKSGQSRDRFRLCRQYRWIGLILLLAAFGGLCIPPGAGQDADHWIKEGYKQMWKGSLGQANESFNKALQIYNEEMVSSAGDSNAALNATNKKVLLLVRLERFDEAILTLDRAIESNPENPEAWKSKGFALIDIAESIEAESRRADGGTAESNTAEGSTVVNSSAENVTIENSSAENVTIENSSIENSTAGSRTIELESRYNQSLQAFRRALELDPSDAEAWRGVAQAYSGLNDQVEALKASDKAVEIAPGNGQSWLDRGILLIEMRRAEEALFAFERVLSIEPDNLDALAMKAEALSSLGRYDEATEAFNRAMGMNTGDFEIGDDGDWLV